MTVPGVPSSTIRTSSRQNLTLAPVRCVPPRRGNNGFRAVSRLRTPAVHHSQSALSSDAEMRVCLDSRGQRIPILCCVRGCRWSMPCHRLANRRLGRPAARRRSPFLNAPWEASVCWLNARPALRSTDTAALPPVKAGYCPHSASRTVATASGPSLNAHRGPIGAFGQNEGMHP